MKRKATPFASTNSVDRIQEPRFKKQRVSDERPQIDAADTQLAIVVFTGGGEPIDHHRKIESCTPSRPTEQIGDHSLQRFTTVEENQLAITVYNGGGEPIINRKKTKSCKPRQPREKIHNGPNPPPELPGCFKEVIKNLGGTDCRLVIQKGLCKTDLSGTHGRLSMPQTKWVSNKALSSELLMMFENGSNGTKNFSVPLIDTKMRFWESVSLRKWNMNKDMVVIAGVWNDVVAANDLKVKDVIQVWCFKFIETGQFGLAMIKLENGDNTDDNGIRSSIAQRSNVSVLSIQPQDSISAGSYTYSGSNQYPSTNTAYFDFLNIEPSNGMADTNRLHALTAGSESSDGINKCGESSTEAVLLAVTVTVTDTDISSSDLDLSLHL